MSRPRDWFEVSEEFTFALAGEDDEPEEALDVLVAGMRQVSRAQTGALYLPSVGDQWLCEAAAGEGSSKLLGSAFEVGPEVLDTLRSGEPIAVEDSLYLPLFSGGELRGCLALTGLPAPLHGLELRYAKVLVQRGAVALDLISSRQAQELAMLLEERERISRDLHDLGIQDLFATGMMLQRLRGEVEAGLSPRRTALGLSAAMERLDEAVRQIRTIVYRLKDEDEHIGLVDALENEASVARTSLGFAPTLTFEMDDSVVPPGSEALERMRVEATERVNEKLTRDLVAVVREALTNVARHARAHSAQVKVALHGSGATGEIEVLIVDDGSGVDPSHGRNSGLANMLRRANENGGTFAVSSGPRGRGTSIVWRSPLGS